MPPPDYSNLSVAELQEQVQRRVLLAQLRLTESLTYDANWIDPREPLYDDASFWTPLSGAVPGNLNNQARGEYLPVYLNALGLKEVRDQSRWLCAYNEFALNAINNRIAYIAGTGMKYRVVRRRDDPKTPEDDTGGRDSLTARAQAALDQFIDDNDWSGLEREIIRRTDRDGEVFLRFSIRRNGLVVRVVEPEFVVETSSDPKNSFGVITDPDDVQTVRGYNIAVNPGYNLVPQFVPGYEILHIKQHEMDRNVKRGLPTFFPVRKNLERAEKMLRNMSVLGQVQATYAVIRKHNNTSAAAVQNFAAAAIDMNVTKPMFNRTDSIKQLLPGSIVDTTANTDYEFPSASVNAAAYVEIIEADLRAVASRLGMPQYMLTSKSDGVNFASSLVAEAPHTKQMECLQHYYARKFGRGSFRRTQNQPVMWRVLVMAARLGLIPHEVLRECEIQVECPRLTVRDRGGETTRLATLSQNKVVSKKTWAALEDLDYEQEQRNMAGEEPDPGADGAPPAAGGQEGAGGDGGDDPPAAELNALLAQLRQDGGAGDDGLPGQEEVAGEQRPETGLTEAVPLAVGVPVVRAAPVPPSEPATPITPHRETKEIGRDEDGNIRTIVTTVELLDQPAGTKEPTP